MATTSPSGTGPAVALILGLVLMFSGNPLLGLLGGVIAFAGFLLFCIRLVEWITRPKPKGESQVKH